MNINIAFLVSNGNFTAWCDDRFLTIEDEKGHGVALSHTEAIAMALAILAHYGEV